MIDFHCHLDLYPDPQDMAIAVQHSGIGLLSVTTTPSAWPGTSRLAHQRPAIRTALGLHPQLAHERKNELHLFDKYLSETRFVGEIGLDGSPALRHARNDQLQVFEHILAACNRAGGRILSIHSRGAASAVLDCLERYDPSNIPVFHWFSGTVTELKRAIDNDSWFSVGPAMLAGAKGRNLVAKIPQNRVLLETDGPFAKSRNSPLNPWDIALARQELTQVWNLDEDRVTRILTENEKAILR
ncbi:TatD DNase family protein [Rhodococcus sp. OAS809]|uniref:Qat anti-phage system TatD family nuclease QatD n=1 Tax=Rhodococcus sp. OAS809 TaxID=2663874 RepID=UPI00178A663B